MEAKLGMVVCSLAGHDKNLHFVIVGLEGEYAYIVNGKQRPLERPKKKKLKHLQLSGKIIPITELTTNSSIRREISKLDNRETDNNA